MKKLVLLISLAFIAAIFTNAQSKSDKMYDTFANKEGISNFSFSKNMIDAIDLDLGENGDEKSVTGDLHQIRFMSYNPTKGEFGGKEFIKKAVGYLPKSTYKKYEDDENDGDAEIWLMGSKRKFQECHVFINNEDNDQLRFVVSFYGDFTVNDLEGLKKTGKGFSEKEN